MYALDLTNATCFPYRRITLDSGRFQATEGLFTPDAWGLDNKGVHKLVHKAVQVRTPLTFGTVQWAGGGNIVTEMRAWLIFLLVRFNMKLF